MIGAATSQISYTASKGAVLAMSRELGVEFARHGIRVNALCPGTVDTPLLQDLGRRSGARATPARAHPRRAARATAGDRQRGAVPRERRVVVRQRLDLRRRRRRHCRVRHPRIDLAYTPRRDRDGRRGAVRMGDAALQDGARAVRAGVPVRGRDRVGRRATPFPGARGDGLGPGPPRRGRAPLSSRLPRAALDGARADEGRDPLRPGGLARRVRGARDVDDVEVRAPAPSVRRREGRRPLQPARAVARRAAANHAALHERARRRSSGRRRTFPRPTWRRTSRRWRG